MNSVLHLVKDVAASPRPRISGRGLARRKLDAGQLACLAAQVVLHERPFDPSVRQAAKLFGVSVPYLMTALELSSAKRAAIASGEDTTPFTWISWWVKASKSRRAVG
jgi:hypothetical protein